MPDKENKYSKFTIKQLKQEFVVSTGSNNKEQLLHLSKSSGSITKVSESHLRSRAYRIQLAAKEDDPLTSISNKNLVQCLKHIQNIVYNPESNEQLISNDDGFYDLNKFRTPDMFNAHSDIDGVVTIPPVFEEFMVRLFPKENERDFMLKWMSKSVFEPQFKIRVAPIVRGRQGTGKNVLITLLAKLSGDSNVINTTLKNVAGGFNSNASECTVCCLDETYSPTKSVADKIKTLITETKLPITRKHEDTKIEKVWANFIILSNDTNPLFIEDDDRRYFVPEYIEHKVDGIETAEFISKLFDWLDYESGIYDLYDYLHYHFSITKNDTEGFFTNLKTDQHRKVVNTNKYNDANEVLTFLESKNKTTLANIKRALPHIQQSSITRILRDAGFVDKTLKVKGVRNRCWVRQEPKYEALELTYGFSGAFKKLMLSDCGI